MKFRKNRNSAPQAADIALLEARNESHLWRLVARGLERERDDARRERDEFVEHLRALVAAMDGTRVEITLPDGTMHSQTVRELLAQGGVRIAVPPAGGAL